MKAEFEADDHLSYRCHGHFHSCRHRLPHCRAVASRQYVAASVQCLLSGLVIVLAGSDGEAARRRQGDRLGEGVGRDAPTRELWDGDVRRREHDELS